MIPISDEPGPRRTFPFVMLSIIAINVLVFLYELSLGPAGLDGLARQAGVVPADIVRGRGMEPAPLGVEYLTLVTSMFLHGGFLHIASNMLYLWIFGDNVEDRFGHLRFLVFYMVVGILAGLAHVVTNLGSTVPSIGASGAIAGVLAAYLLMFPRAPVRTLLLVGPVLFITRVSALMLIGFWFILQLVSGLLELGAISQEGEIAFWAHVGGFVAGLVLTPVFRKR